MQSFGNFGGEMVSASRRAMVGSGCSLLRTCASPARGGSGLASSLGGGIRMSPSLESGIAVIRNSVGSGSMCSSGASTPVSAGGLVGRKSMSFDEGLSQFLTRGATSEGEKMFTKAVDHWSDFESDTEGEEEVFRRSVVKSMTRGSPFPGISRVTPSEVTPKRAPRRADTRAIAKEYMDSGKLVPDNVVVELLSERMQRSDCSQKGWILDGFPRTGDQVEALAKLKKLPHLVIHMDVADEEIIQRILHRKIDPITGTTYNTLMGAPKDPDVAARLITRSDDNVETVRERLATWRRNHDNVISAFSRHNVPVVNVECGGSLTPDEVHMRIRKAVFDVVVGDGQSAASSPSLQLNGPLNIVFVGKPGCGKGTQSVRLGKDFGISHLSTGDMLREVCRSKPPVGPHLDHSTGPTETSNVALILQSTTPGSIEALVA